ncbi:MAG: trimethylamine methyltransferase family protein, partial [Candidatus Marinimicrobia bacterium]|nr:trimethylamine methyltransferase family protein [Candidatus Neomarinimicrobiota bacterium]
MRPTVSFLSTDLIKRIYSESVRVLSTLGVEINNQEVLALLADSGVRIDENQSRAMIPDHLVQRALDTAPAAFKLFDVLGRQTNDFSGSKVHFTPGSAALNILDHNTQRIRKPTTPDYIKYVKVVNQLENIASQSTAFIPADVHEKISDSYRLFLSLLYGEKPVITGAFTIAAFEIMKDLQLAVRGSESALKEKPLTIFSCCPTSPLKWSDVTSQNLIDCARYSIPVEFISMPLSGFVAPVTLTGSIIQHAAETLSGLVISQLVNPGTPVLWGGSPAVFDVRYETTPMGAIETMMIDCANNDVGTYLGLPTQAYIALSDAKILDAQAGLETGIGATLAALSGINNISGPGMLDFESCQSLEKLVLDNEIAGMCLRMVEGITSRDDFPAVPLLQELLRDDHLLISDHTRKYLRTEHYFPGAVIDRANRSRWIDDGSHNLGQRAADEVERLLKEYSPSGI